MHVWTVLVGGQNLVWQSNRKGIYHFTRGIISHWRCLLPGDLVLQGAKSPGEMVPLGTKSPWHWYMSLRTNTTHTKNLLECYYTHVPERLRHNLWRLEYWTIFLLPPKPRWKKDPCSPFRNNGNTVKVLREMKIYIDIYILDILYIYSLNILML